jgi:hypothetical protein
MTHTKLLILGAPRSGTTLLTGMIGAHPQVAMLCEDRAFSMRHLISKRVVGNKLCIPNQIDLEPSLLARLGARLGYSIFKDKSTVSIQGHLEDETMKLITLIRTPQAIVSSIMERGGHPFEEAARRWMRSVEVIAHLREHAPERTILVSFEDLVRDPERTLQSICDFINLAYDADMLEGYRGRTYSDQGGIDPGKADPHLPPSFPTPLGQLYPAAYDTYSELNASITINS